MNWIRSIGYVYIESRVSTYLDTIMVLTKPYRWFIIQCIIMFCTTSNNASNYGDINPGLPDEDVSTCDKNEDKNLNTCNRKITKENEHSSNLPHFKTIVTSRTNGRLGNNLFSYMHLMCVELNFNVTILAEKVVKQSLVTFFKNVDNIPTVDDDACGYYEFFHQFDKAADNLIVDLFKEKSGIDVTMERGPEGISISPIEVAMKYGEEVNAGMESYQKQFLQKFKADSTLLPSDCKYKVRYMTLCIKRSMHLIRSVTIFTVPSTT